MLASVTTVLDVGISIKATHLEGHDSLMSLKQTLRGCLVVIVGTNNSTSAALLAIIVPGTRDEKYSRRWPST